MSIRNRWLLVACLLTVVPALEARRAAPIVVVAGFQVDSGTKVSSQAIDAMADELALELIESGRFRAMDRTWLGIESGRLAGSIEAVRAAAGDGGVDYLVVGRISRFTQVTRYAPPRLSPFGPRIGPSGPGYGLFRRAVALQPMPRQDGLRISVELVDVRTGQSLTQAAAPAIRPGNSNLHSELQQALARLAQALVSWNPPATTGK
jgi:hypothetical protein